MKSDNTLILSLKSELGKWLIGFFGVLFLFALLPRTIIDLVRRIIARSLREILTVVLAGILTEKLSRLIER